MTRERREAARLHVDWTRCEARGACLELLEGVLIGDEDGFPLAVGRPSGQRTDVPIAPGELAAAREAVGACPRLALQLLGPTDGRAGAPTLDVHDAPRAGNGDRAGRGGHRKR